MITLPTELYRSQLADWPNQGRHILAHYDDSSIVVYQAYRPSIGGYAVKHVASQRQNVDDSKLELLLMPMERVYLPQSAQARRTVRLEADY